MDRSRDDSGRSQLQLCRSNARIRSRHAERWERLLPGRDLLSREPGDRREHCELCMDRWRERLRILGIIFRRAQRRHRRQVFDRGLDRHDFQFDSYCHRRQHRLGHVGRIRRWIIPYRRHCRRHAIDNRIAVGARGQQRYRRFRIIRFRLYKLVRNEGIDQRYGVRYHCRQPELVRLTVSLTFSIRITLELDLEVPVTFSIDLPELVDL